MKFLVTGGAGYIGSNMVKYLQELNHEVVVIDNLSTGNIWALNECELIKIDLCNYDKISELLKKQKFDGIFHFAAKSLVEESFLYQDTYLKNNVLGTMNLLKIMIENEWDNLVFASSASVYGNPNNAFIDETHETSPISPYGKSKLKCEKLIIKMLQKHNLKYSILRYFNVSGANKKYDIGECRKQETHLVPLIFRILDDDKIEFKVYGSDFKTYDGTCVRDYIHIDDIVRAQFMSFKSIVESQSSNILNLGTGIGSSVLEVIKACELVTDSKLKYSFYNRRKGDVPMLVSNISKAQKIINWRPQVTDLEDIVLSSWNWHKSLYKITTS